MRPRVGFWTGTISTLLPSYAITALIITPDSPLVFFWTLSAYLTLRAVQNDRPGFHLLSGISLGLALLSKYTAVFFPASLFLFFVLTPDQRRHLKRWQLYGGWVLAALVFSPVVFWNAGHDWASFAFQSTERARELGKFSSEDLGAFLASQAGVVTPLVFAGMAVTLGLAVKRFFRRPSWKENYLLCLSLPMIGLFTLVATREWVKMNWLIPAYLPLIILMMGYYQERIFAWNWVYRGTAAWTWATVGMLFIVLHLWPFVPQIKVSGSMDTLTGWRELAIHLKTLQTKMPRPQDTFILAWGHKTASEIWFELKGHPPSMPKRRWVKRPWATISGSTRRGSRGRMLFLSGAGWKIFRMKDPAFCSNSLNRLKRRNPSPSIAAPTRSGRSGSIAAPATAVLILKSPDLPLKKFKKTRSI